MVVKFFSYVPVINMQLCYDCLDEIIGDSQLKFYKSITRFFYITDESKEIKKLFYNHLTDENKLLLEMN